MDLSGIEARTSRGYVKDFYRKSREDDYARTHEGHCKDLPLDRTVRDAGRDLRTIYTRNSPMPIRRRSTKPP